MIAVVWIYLWINANEMNINNKGNNSVKYVKMSVCKIAEKFIVTKNDINSNKWADEGVYRRDEHRTI